MADDERAPEPGHFLPGGTGESSEPAAAHTLGGGSADDASRTALTPPDPISRRPLGLGEARPVQVSHEPVHKRATPLPADPEYQGFYSGPPAAPLPEAPTGSLQGTRQVGRVRYTGWQTEYPRTGVPELAKRPQGQKPRQFSERVVVLLSVLSLLVVGGATFGAYKTIDSFNNTVANPLADPSLKPSAEPQPLLPNPTKTIIVQPVPDEVRLQKNALYKVGKIPTIKCKTPTVKPNTKANAQRFYEAMLDCLNETWEPLVLNADYPFRRPKLALANKTAVSPCGGKIADRAFYCGENETITMQWADDIKAYKKEPLIVMSIMTTLAHEYSHHVQFLTNIVQSTQSRQGFAKTKAEDQEWSRRLELQASCLGAAFLGANKATLDIRGQRLQVWEYIQKHSGDEYEAKGVRDHGSRKNNGYWTGNAFKSTNPASCNTYTAPAAKVS